MDIPVYELRIKDDDSEVDYIALVDLPAIEKDFMAFAAEYAKGVPYYTEDGELYEGPTHKDANGRLMTGATHTEDSEYLYHEGEYAKIGPRGSVKESDKAPKFEMSDQSFMNCASCQHSWNLSDGGENPYKCHMCGYDNKPQTFADTYNDYPKQATENAKVALRWAEENGWGECGTPVGKQRANQLANGKNISRDTIARMAAFERQRQNSDKELGDGCGRLMWLAWGGDAGVEWASKKLQQIDKLKASFAITNEDRRIISGPLMLADKLIFRTNDEMGNHYVKFTKETIQKIAIKYAKRGYQKNVNVMHDEQLKLDGVVLFESFITDKERGILPMKGYEDAADGSWFGSMYVENDEAWLAVKENKLKGFSVEGFFDYDTPKETAEQKLKKIIELLFTPITD